MRQGRSHRHSCRSRSCTTSPRRRIRSWRLQRRFEPGSLRFEYKRERARSERPSGSVPLPRCRILVVDEDTTVQRTVSALFATDYSLKISRHANAEPDKQARTVIGANAAKVFLDSRRGQISLIRRASFTSVGGASSTASAEHDENEDNDSD